MVDQETPEDISKIRKVLNEICQENPSRDDYPDLEEHLGLELSKRMGLKYISVNAMAMTKTRKPGKKKKIELKDPTPWDLTNIATEFWIVKKRPLDFVMRNPCGNSSPDIIVVLGGNVALKLEVKDNTGELNETPFHHEDVWHLCYRKVGGTREGCYFSVENLFINSVEQFVIEETTSDIKLYSERKIREAEKRLGETDVHMRSPRIFLRSDHTMNKNIDKMKEWMESL